MSATQVATPKPTKQTAEPVQMQEPAHEKKRPKTYKPASTGYHPNPLERLGLWMVGSTHESHFTKADVRFINMLAPLMSVVALSAGAAAAIAVTTFAGVGIPGAIGAGAFYALMITAFDRTVIGQETKKKAMEAAKRIVNGPSHGIVAKTGNLFSTFPRHLALATRIAIALASGTVVSKTVLTAYVFRGEIQTVFNDRFEAANKNLLTYTHDQEVAYDARTADLVAELKGDTAQLNAERAQYMTVSGAPVLFDPSSYQVRLTPLENQKNALEAQLATDEQQQAQFQATADAEEVGARLGHRGSGHAGRGPAWKAATIQATEAASDVQSLQQQVAQISAQIDSIQGDMQNAQHSIEAAHDEAVQNLNANVQALTASVNDLTADIQSRQSGRDGYFAALNVQMTQDPTYVKPQSGLLASLSALDQMLGEPQNQGSPRALYFALMALLVGIETSPVIAAAMRPTTLSELKSAHRDLLDTMSLNNSGPLRIVHAPKRSTRANTRKKAVPQADLGGK